MGVSKLIICLFLSIFFLVLTGYSEEKFINNLSCNAKVKAIVEKSLARNFGDKIYVSKEDITDKLCRYATNVFSYQNGSKIDDDDVSSTILRLSKSSLSFLYCDLNDWKCIESKNIFNPKAEFRSLGKSNSDTLGEPVTAGKSLSIDYFFADHLRKNLDQPSINPMSTKLIDFINKTKEELVMSLYGIDDGVINIYDVIIEKDEELKRINGEPRIFGVFDAEPDLFKYNFKLVAGIPKIIDLKNPLLFTYVTPTNENEWVFGRPDGIDGVSSISSTIWNKLKKEADGNKTAFQMLQQLATNDYRLRMGFKYNKTGELIKALNKGVKSDNKSVARIEMPMDSAIQHNKFMVSDEKSVWTGTTNVAGDCIGQELNSNIAILINNDVIAKEFKNEFLEMFTFDPSLQLKVSSLANSNGSTELPAGRFHQNKKPNTKRYFTFDDGTELRVHFAPTDDAEHRVILPMLYSAKKGDKIKISMFGNSGLELMSGIKYAANNGAHVQVLLDHISAAQKSSWTHPKNPNNICTAKTYNPQKASEGGIFVITSGATGSFNHMKVGIKNNELLIVGSQNWSLPGNDSNDENMITIRKDGGLPIIKDVDKFFQVMWKDLMDKRVKIGAEEVKKHGPWVCGDFPEKSQRDEEKE